MRKNFQILFLLTFYWSIKLQTANCQLATSSYAVVVGISDYQNSDIPDLLFAQKGAAAFVQYLQSPAGGSMEDDHIIYLLNENATAGKFASALDWLINKTKEGDQAIIYFAGHGDVERRTISQPGFLLCWDSPAKVYMGGGTFGLAYLKDIVSILSLQTKAKLVLITDISGIAKTGIDETEINQNLADYLTEKFANEIKIIYCHSTEFSIQGHERNEGSGVFSHNLLNGLTGLADRNGDGLVSLFEIGNYLTDKCSKTTLNKIQLPITVGEKNSIVSTVDSKSLKTLQSNESSDLYSGELLASNSKKRIMDIQNPTDLNLIEKYNNFQKALIEGHLLIPEENSAWSLYQDLKDKSFVSSEILMLQNNLAAAFQDEAQQAINDYLNSDPSELKKRWSYDNRYEKFPVYLNKAAELLGENHLLYKTIKAREHYFTGLNLRLLGERKKDTTLYHQAILEQNKTLTLDSTAAYAYNELGILQRRFKNYAGSIPFFNQAIALSPKWVFPWANLSGSYNSTGNTEMAIKMGLKAVEIDSMSILAQYNLANALQHNSNWKDAAKHYLKSLELDSTDKDALLNLAQVLYEDKNYLQAEYYVLKCEKMYPDYPRVYLPLTFIYIHKGQNDKALKALEKTFQFGFKEIEELEQEADFKKLLMDPGYITLKKKYFN